LLKRLNEGLKRSRKLVAVWSKSYFRDDKVWTLTESYAQQQPDLLARERPLIPALIETCDIHPRSVTSFASTSKIPPTSNGVSDN
jgi:hypothetical protein